VKLIADFGQWCPPTSDGLDEPISINSAVAGRPRSHVSLALAVTFYDHGDRWHPAWKPRAPVPTSISTVRRHGRLNRYGTVGISSQFSTNTAPMRSSLSTT